MILVKKSFLPLIALLFSCQAMGQEGNYVLLRKAELGMKSTVSLEARFSQEKLIPFLDVPLISEGKLCFDISQVSSPFVFWEYRTPSRSGFLYENGDVCIWMRDDPAKDPAPSEKDFLNAMHREMLDWITFDHERIAKKYDLATRSVAERILILTPRKKHPLFKNIELKFSEDFSTLSRIKLTGHEEDVTVLTFHPQSINSSLSADCRK